MSQQKLEQQESAFKKEISIILKTKCKNILFKDITITAVKISKDNSYATIYWTIFLDNLDINVIDHALNKATGFCRTTLAKTSTKFKVPTLRFKYDNTNDNVKKINEILQNIKTTTNNE